MLVLLLLLLGFAGMPSVHKMIGIGAGALCCSALAMRALLKFNRTKVSTAECTIMCAAWVKFR
jgi:hypothetical protein